jgi:hypothetical protein
VIRHFAASIRFKNLNTKASEHIGGSKHAGFLRSPPDRKYMRVFEQQKVVKRTILDHFRLKLLLQSERVRIRDPPKASNL